MQVLLTYSAFRNSFKSIITFLLCTALPYHVCLSCHAVWLPISFGSLQAIENNALESKFVE